MHDGCGSETSEGAHGLLLRLRDRCEIVQNNFGECILGVVGVKKSFGIVN
jgi:hypothetical protein